MATPLIRTDHANDSAINGHSTIDGSEPSVAELQRCIERLERLRDSLAVSATGKEGKSLRFQSNRTLFGYPIYDIAFGPDHVTGAVKGHAKGIIAIGNRATGFVAIGGMAQGIIAIGGLSWGLFTAGGCTLGLVAGVGGVAAGGIVLGGGGIIDNAFGAIATSLLPALTAMFATSSSGI